MEDKSILNPSNQRNILIIIIILLLVWFGFSYNKIKNLEVDLNISEQNKKALGDSLRVSKNKSGDLEYSKNILISEKGELKDLNKDLASELKKEKGKVSELNTIVASIKNKPNSVIEVTNTLIEYPDGTFGLKWSYDTIYDANNSRHLAGTSNFKLNDSIPIALSTKITKDEINFKLVTGLREKDGNIEIFARSDYPGFEVIQLDGAIIDPKNHPVIQKFTKKKKFHVGPYLGVGIGTGLSIQPQIGVGLTYSLISF